MKLLLSLLLSLWLLVFTAGAQNQQLQVKGKVIDEGSSQPVPYAAVTAFRPDSTLAGGGITSENGTFSFPLPKGEYFLKLEFISYAPKTISAVNLSDHDLDIGIVKLAPAAINLESVEVQGERAQLQLSLDKKVYNVGKDINAIGGTARDVLENVPSVNVDVDGGIQLRGNNNVRILIDGRPSSLTGGNTQQILEQIQAGSIESIEVITNPSSRYDAEGMTGIINIVLKKEKKRGFNGLVNLAAGYPADYNGSFNFNYGRKGINWFGSLSSGYSQRPGISENNRRTYYADSTSYFLQSGTFQRNGISGNARIGNEIYLSPKASVTTSAMFRKSSGENDHEIRYEFRNNSGELYSYSTRELLEQSSNEGLDVSSNFKKNFTKKGRIFTSDMQFSVGSDNSRADVLQQAHTPAGDATGSTLKQLTLNDELQKNFTWQADYSSPILENYKIETGLKATIRNVDKTFEVREYDNLTMNWLTLASQTNQFLFGEDVLAAYASVGGSSGKWSFQAGTRAEQTLVTSVLAETQQHFDKQYFNLFPSAYINRELPANHKMQLSYTRRINRPNYFSLNPFMSFSDPYNLFMGNPDLNAELTHALEASHLKFWQSSNISTTFYYRITDRMIQRIRLLDTATGVARTFPVNLATGENLGVEVNYSRDITRWWRLNLNLNGYRSWLSGGENAFNFSGDFFSWTGKANSQFTLSKTTSLQLMLNYRAPQRTTQGEVRQMYFADAGVKKDILQGKGTVNFRVSDIFNTKRHLIETFGDNFYISTVYRRSVRTFFVGFSYKINSYKAKESKRDQNYSGDEMF